MLVPHPDRGLRAVITDFGLAGTAVADRSEVARARGFSGTFAYAAPERISGRSATPASDVYSFGLVAQQMLTGHLPPTASAAVVAAALRLGERLGWEERVPSAYQPAWDRFVLGTLHPDPARRFQNGAELREALRDLTVKRQGAGGRSRRLTALVGGVVTVAVLASIAIRRPSPPATRSSATRATAAPLATASEQIEAGQGDATPSWLHAPAPRARAKVSSPGAPQKSTHRRLAAASPVSAVPVASVEAAAEADDAASDHDIVRELRPRTGASAAEVVAPEAARAGVNKGRE
jgi:hypothetical protein